MCLIFVVLTSVVTPVYADLDVTINRAILEAAKHDTSRSDKDKLFKNRCETIKKYVGFEDNVTGQARKYSCDVAGVGIALFVGKDFGKHPPEKIGQYFIDKLAERGLKAEVFIKKGYEHGSSMAFYINGTTWMMDYLRPSEALNKINFLANETKLILFNEKRISDWIHDPKKN